MLDNLKKNIFIKNSRNRKKWDGKETSPNYLQKKIFIRNTIKKKKMGREGNKSKLRTKENLSVKGGGVGGLEGGCGAQEKA